MALGFLGQKPLVWMRYIDDILFSWTHGEDYLKEFISHLNSSRHTIKFTSECSRVPLNFLDVSIKVGVGEPWGHMFFSSLLIPISTCIENCVTYGTPKKPFPLVML